MLHIYTHHEALHVMNSHFFNFLSDSNSRDPYCAIE